MKGHNAQANTVDVALTIEPKEKPFGKIIYQKVTEKYFSAHAASKALQLTAGALGRVMGSIIVMPGRVDIGLNFKVFGNLCLPGYAPHVKIPAAKSGKTSSGKNVWSSGKGSAKMLFHGGKDPSESGNGKFNNRSGGNERQSERVRWEYSERAIQMVATYKKKFKRVFTTLLANPDASKFSVKDIAPKQEDFESLCRWLQQLQTYKQPLVPHTSETMCHSAVCTVEAAATKQRATSLSERKTVLVKGLLPTELYKPDVEGFANAGKGPGTDLNKPPALGDRIVNIRCPFVPLGLRGTVVSIHPSTGCVEALFDSEFIGGQDLNGLCSRGRGRLVKWSEVLSLSKPENASIAKTKERATKSSWTKANCSKNGSVDSGYQSVGQKEDNLSVLLKKAGITVERKQRVPRPCTMSPKCFILRTQLLCRCRFQLKQYPVLHREFLRHHSP